MYRKSDPHEPSARREAWESRRPPPDGVEGQPESSPQAGEGRGRPSHLVLLNGAEDRPGAVTLGDIVDLEDGAHGDCGVAAAMLHLPHMPSKRISAAAVIAILAFAGFGCRPILDAQNRTQQAAEEKRSQSMWVLQEPELTYRMAPDDTGYAYLDFRTQEGASVTARLTGPPPSPPGERPPPSP